MKKIGESVPIGYTGVADLIRKSGLLADDAVSVFIASEAAKRRGVGASYLAHV